MTDKFGCRRVCIVGSLMGSAGILIASFSPNIYVLYLANGLIIGNLWLLQFHETLKRFK